MISMNGLSSLYSLFQQDIANGHLVVRPVEDMHFQAATALL